MSRSTQPMESNTFEVNDDDLLVSSVITNKAFPCSQKRYNFKKKKPPPRTVLSWLVHSGVVSRNEVIQFRSPTNDAVVKEGIVKKDYLLCLCCAQELSITEFKRHAGFRLNRRCMNLFMDNGKPFILSHLEAWSVDTELEKRPWKGVEFFTPVKMMITAGCVVVVVIWFAVTTVHLHFTRHACLNRCCRLETGIVCTVVVRPAESWSMTKMEV